MSANDATAKAIAAVLRAAYFQNRSFQPFLCGEDAAEMRQALEALEEAVSEHRCQECGSTDIETFTADWDVCGGCGDLIPPV